MLRLWITIALALSASCGGGKDEKVSVTRAAVTRNVWPGGAATAQITFEPVPPATTGPALSTIFTSATPSANAANTNVGTGGGGAHSGNWAARFSRSGSSVTVEARKTGLSTSACRSGTVKLSFNRRFSGTESSDKWTVSWSGNATAASPTWTAVAAAENQLAGNASGTGSWQSAPLSYTLTQGSSPAPPTSADFGLSFKAVLSNSLDFSTDNMDFDDISLTCDEECLSNADCNDGNSCTTDSCNASTFSCSHTPIATGSACTTTQLPNGVCNAAGTCVECVAASNCNDSDACTTDTCTGSFTCSHTAVNCSDGQFCNGTETCNSSSGCQAGTPPVVSDNIACTADSCDESMDRVVHTPVDSACDDGNPCTADLCSASSGCSHDAASMLNQSCPHSPTPWVCNGSGACVQCTSDAQCGGGNNRCLFQTCFCSPDTCAKHAGSCGVYPDGCGGTLDCRAACGSGQVCDFSPGPNAGVCIDQCTDHEKDPGEDGRDCGGVCPTPCSERVCADGVDDDHDGFLDCNDIDCVEAGQCDRCSQRLLGHADWPFASTSVAGLGHAPSTLRFTLSASGCGTSLGPVSLSLGSRGSTSYTASDPNFASLIACLKNQWDQRDASAALQPSVTLTTQFDSVAAAKDVPLGQLFDYDVATGVIEQVRLVVGYSGYDSVHGAVRLDYRWEALGYFDAKTDCLTCPAFDASAIKSDFCSSRCACDIGQGGCTRDSDCRRGLICEPRGAWFGYQIPGLSVCVPASCANGVKDGTETGVDCGGNQCGACPNCALEPGCSPSCPCDDYKGPCATNADCRGGSACGTDNARRFGKPNMGNVCWPSSCSAPSSCGTPRCGPCAADCSYFPIDCASGNGVTRSEHLAFGTSSLRSSSATYVNAGGLVQLVGPHELRVKNGTSGVLSLFEGGRTNYALESTTPSQWPSTHLTFGSPAPAAPFIAGAGLSADVTAVHAVSTGAPSEQYLQQHFVLPELAGQRIAASAFVQKASGTPQPGTIVVNTPSGYGASGFTPGSSWQRISGASGSGPSGDFDVFFALGGFGAPQAPAGYDLDLAMPQVEAGSFPSSFILSYGGPEKRDLDRVVLDARTVPSWLLSGKYTLEVEPIFGTAEVATVAQRFVLFEFGAADQWLGFESDGAGKLSLVAQAGAARTTLALPAFASSQRFTLSVSPSTGDLAASIASSAAHGASWRWPARNVSVGARGEGTLEDAAFAWIGQPTTAPAPAPACNVTAYADGTGCGVGAEWCQAAKCQLSAACGNGVVDRDGISAPIETCDDGNNLPNDGCSPECASEAMSIAPNNVTEDEPGVRTHALGADDLGRLLFVWQSDEAESSRLLARRATAAGVTVDSEQAPIEVASDLGLKWPAEPAVVGLTGGGWAVLWADSQQSGDAARVVFRLVGVDGTLSALFSVTDSASAPSNQHQTSVSAAPLGNGFVAAWVDQRLVQGSPDSSSVRARLFDVHGAPASSELAIADAPGDTALEPAVAGLGTQWIAAWSRGDDLSLRARRYDGATPLGNELVVAADARSPAVAALLPALPKADFALAWNVASDQRVRVLELLGTDTAPSDSMLVTDGTDGRPELYPSVAPLGRDAFVVGFGYGNGFRDADFRVIPRAGHLYTTQPEEVALRAQLGGDSNQRDLALSPAGSGVWFTWADDGAATAGQSGALPNAQRAFLLGCEDCQLPRPAACFGQDLKIVPSDLTSLSHSPTPFVGPGSAFGAAVRVSSDLAAVGAPDDASAGTDAAGAVFAYRQVNGAWVEQQRLLGETQTGPSYLGGGLSVDSNRILAGATGEPSGGVNAAGAAYVFEWNGQTWARTRIQSPAPVADGFFGQTTALHGEWMFVSEGDANTGGAFGEGRVHVYRHSGDSWVHAQALTVPEPPGRLNWTLGSCGILVGDDVAIITNYNDNQNAPSTPPNGVGTSTYSFRYNGSSWVLDQDLSPAGLTDACGAAIDGHTALISVRENNVYGVAIYEDANGSWQRTSTIWAPEDLPSGYYFGFDLALKGDIAALGANDYYNNPNPSNERPGRVYLYQRDALRNTWNLVASVNPPPGVHANWFSAAIALTDNGMLVGASDAPDPNYSSPPGAVYAFACPDATNCGDGWVEAGEDCDDGNRVTESCSVANQSCRVCGADCHFAYPTCGDGIVQQPAENCDDGNAVTEYCPDFAACSTCSASCTIDSGRFCGDNIVDSQNGEQCDDGNHLDGDGCSHLCRLECVRIATTDTTCDGVDDDCDGTVDDDFVAQPTSCGLGTCARTGQIQCVGGTLTTNCSPGAPSGGDTVCDGINDDCDVSTDEGYVAQATTCGVGVCQRSGQRSCVSGAVVDSCVAGSPTGTDSDCNGLDENCNGQTDEGYVPTQVSCGVGVCLATKATRCVNGSVDSSCTPLPPIASLDFTCDAKDDDCDGVNDDDYVRPNVSCGTGACRVTVQAACVNGAVSSSCTPLSPPSQTDTSCDGVDNNCNGTTDEGYVSTATSCGVGACARTGSTSCVAGAVKDSCTPGAPALDDYACDGIDDDCDGTKDEDCTCNGQTASVSAQVSAGRAYRQDQSCGTTPVTPFGPDGFENYTAGSSTWTTGTNWTKTGTVNIITSQHHAGSKAADMTRGTSAASTLRTVGINTSGMSGITLSFWRSVNSGFVTSDTLTVRYSTNGTSWSSFPTETFSLSSAAWAQKTFSLPASAAAPALQVSLETSLSTGRHVYIDDVQITATAPCLTPTWYATGSNELIGTDVNASVTLYALQSAPSIWHLGACPICGNGALQNGEACDDGNRVDEYCGTSSCQICNYHCQLVAGGTCGDGIIQSPQEQCDDGNTIDTDGCKNDCTLPCSATCGWGCQNNTCLQPVQLSGAEYYSCAAVSDGRMACWGNNTNPAFVAGYTNVVRVAAGNTHTCALLSDRTVKCTGGDGRGQLGDGPGTGGSVLGLNDAVSLGAGQGHGCAARANGQVVCWGENEYGQVGDGTTVDRNAPVTVPGIADAVAVGVGPWHSCALLSDTTVRCWGRNDAGQTGDGTTTNRLLPVKAQGVSAAVQVSVGAGFTCARKSDGTVWCWGGNGSGGLGNGSGSSFTPVQVTGINDAVDVSAFAAHACVLRASGQVACWGFNEHSQLGDGTTLTNPSPVTVPNLAAKAVSVGWQHTCALTTAGAVVCWGSNDFKEIGDGSFVDTSTPQAVIGLSDAVSVSAGAVHSCALRATGGVTCWGNNLFGQLGDQTTQDRAVPVPVQGLTGIAQVAPAFEYTCARRTSGAVTCWGTMTGFPSGNFSATPVDLPAVTNAIDLGRGRVESCAIRSNGHVICWGYDDGFGGRPPTEIAGVTDGVSTATEGVDCVVRSNGHIACLGPNDLGTLGDGTTTSRYTFADVSGISDAQKVSVGENHSCALRSGGRVSCWGQNGYGQLGNGQQSPFSAVPVDAAGVNDAVDVSVGIYFSCAVRATGGVLCWGNQNGNGPGATPLAVPGISDATNVGAGWHHACVRRNGGGVSCWGRNVEGEIGVGVFPYSKVPVNILLPN